MTTYRIRRRRQFLARTIAVTALTVAALGAGAGTASARPSCPTLSSAIAKMAMAAENAREAGNMETANYRAQTVLYYQSLSDQYGCI
jgi:hypothetical protein